MKRSRLYLRPRFHPGRTHDRRPIIPAFMKYIRRAKTVEATMNIRKMFDATVSYFASKHADPAGLILAK